MLSVGGILKSAIAKRGFTHRRTEDQFSIRGQYARNLQHVYSKQYKTSAGRVVDLLYVAVDVVSEKLVLGLYRENPDIENGVYLNSSRVVDLRKFNADHINRELDKLITPVKDKFKKEIKDDI